MHLTPEGLAIVQAAVLPLAKPRPAGDGGRDERTAGQRLHDAIVDMARRLLNSGTLPTTGGTPATVVLTMSLEQLESRTGLVTTGHGGQLTVTQALRLAGEADIIPVVLDTDGILGYGRARRTAPAMQRRALTARDGGCVMAGCDYPAMSARAKSGSPARAPASLRPSGARGSVQSGPDAKRGVREEPTMRSEDQIDPERTPIRNRMHDTSPAA